MVLCSLKVGMSYLEPTELPLNPLASSPKISWVSHSDAL